MIWFVLVDSSRILRSVRYTVCVVGVCQAIPWEKRRRGVGTRLRLGMMASLSQALSITARLKVQQGGWMWRQADGHVRDSGMW